MFCSQCGQQNVSGAKFCCRCGIALRQVVPSEPRYGATDAEIARYLDFENRTYGTANLIGVVLIGIAALGLWTTIANPPASAGPLPNVINMTLLGAFGIAVVGKKRMAIALGWSYFALLTLMTAAHGFIPLEIAQVLALFWFMSHLHKKLTGGPAGTV